MIHLEYPIYQRVEGTAGSPFMCHVLENGKSRLVFSGASAEAVLASAKEWANRELDTPERRQRFADLAAARKARKEKANA